LPERAEKRDSFTHCGLHPDLSAMPLHHPPDQHKAPTFARRDRGVQALKDAENLS